MTAFVRGALVEDNTVSECIRTVAATYGRKVGAPNTDYDITISRYLAVFNEIFPYFGQVPLIFRHQLRRYSKKKQLTLRYFTV